MPGEGQLPWWAVWSHAGGAAKAEDGAAQSWVAKAAFL